MTETGDDRVPAALGQAALVIGKTVDDLLERDLDPLAIASALLGAALGLLSRAMSDEAVLGVLANAAESVRSGELRAGLEG